MKKIMTIVGARPQFVKAAVVSRAFYDLGGIDEVLVHTGQHFDENMSDIFFRDLDIPHPRYNLGIGGLTHAQNTGRALERIEQIIVDESPELVVVYGDTDATLAGALAAAKLCVPIAHVEAGLRSFNRKMPEEINRIVADHLSALLFVPSQAAVQQLAREGIAGNHVSVVGDVMYDAVLKFTKLAERLDTLELHQLAPHSYVLATLHRKENTDDETRLRAILDGLSRANELVVLPLHPRTKMRIVEFGISLAANIRILEPVGYLDMLILERNAAVIATDSGGVQKEAYFHKIPCVTLRNETEWVELLALGVNRLVDANTDAIAAAIADAMASSPFDHVNLEVYGNGSSATRIASIVAQY